MAVGIQPPAFPNVLKCLDLVGTHFFAMSKNSRNGWGFERMGCLKVVKDSGMSLAPFDNLWFVGIDHSSDRCFSVSGAGIRRKAS